VTIANHFLQLPSNPKVVVLSPPPMSVSIRNAQLASRIPPGVPDRTEENTKMFADTALAAAKQLKESGKDVEGIDLWTAIQSKIDEETPEKYLSDGLHLTAEVELSFDQT
jgi:hypothetical protein